MSLASATQNARAWLPTNALTDGVLTNLLHQYCEDWGRLWFKAGAPHVGVSSRSINQALFDRKSLAWRSACSRLFLLIEPQSADFLALRLIGLDTAAKTPKVNDQRLLRDLARGGVDDLAHLLARALQVEISPSEHDGVQCFERAIAFKVDLSDRIKFEIFVEHDLAAQWRKHVLPPPRGHGALNDRRNALDTTDVLLSLYLGASTIPLAELHALSIGDVIVTDTEFEARLPLCVNGRADMRHDCAVRQGPAGLQIHF